MRALLIVLGLCLAAPAQARDITLTCIATQLCDGLAKCRKVSGAAFTYTVTARVTGGALLVRGITLWGTKVRPTDVSGGKGFFDTVSGMDAQHNAFLFSLTSNGFMLTQHGVFAHPDANGNVATGSPGAFTVYGPPCDSLPEGDN